MHETSQQYTTWLYLPPLLCSTPSGNPPPPPQPPPPPPPPNRHTPFTDIGTLENSTDDIPSSHYIAQNKVHHPATAWSSPSSHHGPNPYTHTPPPPPPPHTCSYWHIRNSLADIPSSHYIVHKQGPSPSHKISYPLPPNQCMNMGPILTPPPTPYLCMYMGLILTPPPPPPPHLTYIGTLDNSLNHIPASHYVVWKQGPSQGHSKTPPSPQSMHVHGSDPYTPLPTPDIGTLDNYLDHIPSSHYIIRKQGLSPSHSKFSYTSPPPQYWHIKQFSEP